MSNNKEIELIFLNDEQMKTIILEAKADKLKWTSLTERVRIHLEKLLTQIGDK